MQSNCHTVTTLSLTSITSHRNITTYQKRFCHSWVVTACCFKSLFTVGLSSCHLSSNCTPGFLEFNSKEDIIPTSFFPLFVTDLHTFRKLTADQCRQRERRQTKGLMRRTKAVHVRYKSLYISLPFSAKQQREMTKFRVFWRTWATTANILDFPTELIAGITYLVWAGF